MNRFCCSARMAARSAGGTMHQPMRHPVMQWYLLNELITSSLSPAPGASGLGRALSTSVSVKSPHASAQHHPRQNGGVTHRNTTHNRHGVIRIDIAKSSSTIPLKTVTLQYSAIEADRVKVYRYSMHQHAKPVLARSTVNEVYWYSMCNFPGPTSSAVDARSSPYSIWW